jgi:hypothetical protein
MMIFLFINLIKLGKMLTFTNLRRLTIWDGGSIFFKNIDFKMFRFKNSRILKNIFNGKKLRFKILIFKKFIFENCFNLKYVWIME